MKLIRSIGAGMAVAMLLALWACHDGGDGPLPAPLPASVNAADDAAALDWNTGIEVDVLANDSASSGAPALAALGQAAHGTAEIVAGKVLYTPAPGYFGADSVDYTVVAAEGGAMANARLALTVNARMVVHGLAADAALAGAAVVVTVGGQDFAGTADAGGAYSVAITGADPAAFVQVSASGAGAQSGVRLLSLVGPLSTLAAAADTQGQVLSAQLSALDATHWTSAAAALAARANGGSMPADAAALARAAAAIDPLQLQCLAAVVRLVADEGAALPPGKADTVALLGDEAALDSFVQGQQADDAARYDRVLAGVLADAPSVAITAPAANGPQTLVYEAQASGGGWVRILFRSDGTADVRLAAYGASHAAAQAAWSRTGDSITVRFAAPVVEESYSIDVDAVTGRQNLVQLKTAGLVVKTVAGGAGISLSTLSFDRKAIYADGSRAGQLVPGSDDPSTTLMSVHDLADRLEITAAETAPGARWAGVMASHLDYDNSQRLRLAWADILRLGADGAGTLEFSGQAVQWAVADRWLTVSRADGNVIRYARLSSDPATGQEVWFASEGAAGAETDARALTLVRADGGLAFSADSAARNWWPESSPSCCGADDVVRLFADGGGRFFGDESLTWALRADGQVELTRTVGGQLWQLRHWQMVRRVGSHVTVFETFDPSAPTVIASRVMRYRDLGPAVQ